MARVHELERTLASLREDSEVAYVLLGLSGALAEVRSTQETLGLAVRTVPELFGASCCFAARWDRTTEAFEVLASSGYPEPELEVLRKQVEVADGMGLLWRALKERVTIAGPKDEGSPGAGIAIPLLRWDEDFGVLFVELDLGRELDRKDLALAGGVARQVGVALNNARRFGLLTNLRRFGYEVGTKVRISDVVDDVLAGAVELLDADAAWIYFPDPNGKTLSSAGGHSRTLALPERLARLDVTTPPWSSIPAGETVVTDAFHDLFGGRDVTIVATLLASARDRFVGALVGAFERSRVPSTDELEAFQVLAGQAAQALDNSRRFEKGRSVARKMQAALLRTEDPDLGGAELGAVYEPADGEADVGGDFYDVIELPEGRFALVVGDVSGKGAEAAAQTAMVKYMLRGLANRNPSPSSVLFHLNNALIKDMDEDAFTTVLYVLFEPGGKGGQVATAGHPCPMIYRAATGEVEEIGSPGMIVGAFDDQNFEHVPFSMGPADIFLAFTDGLVETRSGNEMFGEERVKAALAKHVHEESADALARAMYTEARSFGRVTDDTAVLALIRKDVR